MEDEKKMFEKRFVYFKQHNFIKDNLTGFTYNTDNDKIVELLNKLDERANKNAEKYFEEKYKKEKL